MDRKSRTTYVIHFTTTSDLYKRYNYVHIHIDISTKHKHINAYNNIEREAGGTDAQHGMK